MWRNRGASIKDDPVNPPLIDRMCRQCVCVCVKTQSVHVCAETTGLYHDLIREK